jgi:hypothetical protein
MEGSSWLHAPAALLPVKEPQMSIRYVTEWASEPVWTFWTKDQSFSPARSQTTMPFDLPCCVAELTTDSHTVMTLFLHQYPLCHVVEILVGVASNHRNLSFSAVLSLSHEIQSVQPLPPSHCHIVHILQWFRASYAPVFFRFITVIESLMLLKYPALECCVLYTVQNIYTVHIFDFPICQQTLCNPTTWNDSFFQFKTFCALCCPVWFRSLASLPATCYFHCLCLDTYNQPGLHAIVCMRACMCPGTFWSTMLFYCLLIFLLILNCELVFT